MEIEHVDTVALDGVARPNLTIQPDPATIRVIQDKYAQKLFISQKSPNVPISPFCDLAGPDLVVSLKEIGARYGYPMMLKSKKLAYDGRGNRVVKDEADVPAAIADLGGKELYVEKWVPFSKELAVMVAKGLDGTIVSYPCVETVQKDNICHLVIAPAPIDGALRDRARKIAHNIISSFTGYGIFGVELFLLEDGQISFNEVAPRPHNSGHYTIEACFTSQYEQHLRCITGMPLGSAAMKVPCSIMINIIGQGEGEEGMQKTLSICHDALLEEGATIHLYGKKECKKGRKMGHVTLVGDSMTSLLKIASDLTKSPLPSSLKPAPLVGIIMGSDSDLPTVKPAAAILRQFGIPFELTIVSAHRTPQRMAEYARTARKRGLNVIIAAAGGAAHLPGMVGAHV